MESVIFLFVVVCRFSPTTSLRKNTLNAVLQFFITLILHYIMHDALYTTILYFSKQGVCKYSNQYVEKLRKLKPRNFTLRNKSAHSTAAKQENSSQNALYLQNLRPCWRLGLEKRLAFNKRLRFCPAATIKAWMLTLSKPRKRN
jgi:hypothetical protein